MEDRTGLWVTADPDSHVPRATEPDPRSYLRQVSAEVSDAHELSLQHETQCMCIKYITPHMMKMMKMRRSMVVDLDEKLCFLVTLYNEVH